MYINTNENYNLFIDLLKMTFKAVLLYLILNVFQAECGVCPAKEVVYPCVCKSDNIICDGNETINIKKVFKEMSLHLNSSAKTFSFFILNNTAVTQLEDNTFNDITFTDIYITNATSLEKISANAFSPANSYTVEYFVQRGASKLCTNESNQSELYTALSSLMKLKGFLLTDTGAQSVPMHAFDVVAGIQSHLNSVQFNEDTNIPLHLVSIGDYAFYYLTNVTEILLHHNQIFKISLHSFEMFKPSNTTLVIELSYNKLSDRSIEVGALTNAKRPLNIFLNNNYLSYLDERVFSLILNADARNVIHINNNPIECDCRMHWLLKGKDVMHKQVPAFNCNANNKTFWSLTEADFVSCD